MEHAGTYEIGKCGHVVLEENIMLYDVSPIKLLLDYGNPIN